MNVRQKQRYVIKFLNAEVQQIDINKSLVNVYGGETVDVRTVRKLVRRFQSGDGDASDKPRSGHPSTATNDENEARLHELIKSNWRITLNEMSTELGVSVSAVEKLISFLGYSKRRARWVPRILTLEPRRPPGDCQSRVGVQVRNWLFEV